MSERNTERPFRAQVSNDLSSVLHVPTDTIQDKRFIIVHFYRVYYAVQKFRLIG